MKTLDEPEDIRPEPVTFKLFATGDREHAFRVPTIADQRWAKTTFNKPLHELFQEGNEIPFKEIARIWLHHLVDASPFEPEVRRFRDRETGEEREELITGSERVMESVGSFEFDKVMVAFVKSISKSRATPEMAQALTDGAEKKTKTAARRVGPSSSTRSALSTAGHGMTSGH